MMILSDIRAQERPELILSDLIAAHGARRMVVVFAQVLMRQNRAPPIAALRLSDHMMRDIGLEPMPDIAPPWQLLR